MDTNFLHPWEQLTCTRAAAHEALLLSITQTSDLITCESRAPFNALCQHIAYHKDPKYHLKNKKMRRAYGHFWLFFSVCLCALVYIKRHKPRARVRSRCDTTVQQRRPRMQPSYSPSRAHLSCKYFIQISKKHTSGLKRRRAMTSKPQREAQQSRGVRADTLMRDAYGRAGVRRTHRPKTKLSRSQELLSVCVWQLSDTGVSIPEPCVSQTPLRCGFSSQPVCVPAKPHTHHTPHTQCSHCCTATLKRAFFCLFFSSERIGGGVLHISRSRIVQKSIYRCRVTIICVSREK